MADYQKLARRVAKRAGIDPNVFVAMIRQESGFNPNARSPAGAQGIAQFMPATARAYGVNLNDGRVTDDLEGAAKYLSENLRKYGSYKRALSVYNSGRPDAYKDPNFAHGQTYNYVRTILGNSNPSVTAPTAHPKSEPVQADIPQASPVNAGLDQDARKAAVMNFVMQGGIRNTSATQALASTITSLNRQAQVAAPIAPATGATTLPRTTHGSGRSGPERGVGGQLYELFWQGHNGINVKNGQPEPQGFVSGHTDHVHVAAGPRSVIRLGKLAERMGLHVGENPAFGGVTPVHVKDSYHYKGQAIDVSGDPALMAKYAHRVARLYGAS